MLEFCRINNFPKIQTLMKIFEELDIFDKFQNNDLKKHTKIGTNLSAFFIMVGFSITLIAGYFILKPRVIRNLTLESKSIDSETRVNISFTIDLKAPCSKFQIKAHDVFDFSKSLPTTATFRRLDKNGKLIEVLNRTENVFPERQGNFIIEIINYLPQQYSSNQPGEQCQIKGKFSSRIVTSLISLFSESSTSFLSTLFNQHQPFDFRVSRFRFGPQIPFIKQPLDHSPYVPIGKNRYNSFSYVMTVTPVHYFLNDELFEEGGFEYHVTEKIPFFDDKKDNSIIFYYKFTPYTINLNVYTNNWVMFFSSTLGLLSGIFTIFVIIDKFFPVKILPAALEKASKISYSQKTFSESLPSKTHSNDPQSQTNDTLLIPNSQTSMETANI